MADHSYGPRPDVGRQRSRQSRPGIAGHDADEQDRDQDAAASVQPAIKQQPFVNAADVTRQFWSERGAWIKSKSRGEANEEHPTSSSTGRLRNPDDARFRRSTPPGL